MDKIDLLEWKKWFSKYVEPIFVPSNRDNYYDKIKNMQTPFYPKYWIAERFYDKIKNDTRFDDELKKYFAFLYSCGFFMDYVITFEEWLNLKNWENPFGSNQNSETILEILKKPNGEDELKQKLRWFPFVNRSDGF
ncbi:MAG: hypothetical protein JJ885_07955 [Muricauda sp.]|nr:hypothetical protein [Allomuricauda sp.]MBO6533487.1 hypothetical protein [Allomuricauda sp.]MBO6589618.1 hypothetical protein [Allomuricauda sp.]MBO6619449.1 hypothetical protein [Allomuricauda sp.]MBO6645360.1 hypothetical protein [Allomuricauda sp.]MBO6747364.1 hypothetical protein [Allomuricauda sp.]